MANNKKIWLTNLLFVLVLPALVYGITPFIDCGFLCINRFMWGYCIVMGCALIFSVANAVFYKRYTSRVALIPFVFWAVLFLFMLCYYIMLRCT